ncbi:MAG TPA: DUF262 domain-containing protein [Candidatus Binatia bacterium]|nr:DUF262 domain-containing protein [Candidatus Binatia bacterium]
MQSRPTRLSGRSEKPARDYPGERTLSNFKVECDVPNANLAQFIDESVVRLQTTSLDVSFNELLDMHKTSELNIRPEFQRLFRWSLGAQSRFIESLLLEMPVPPIYVIEVDEGRYELIDGLQRISTYLHLRGELEVADVPDPVKKGERLCLVDCDIVEELNGLTFEDLSPALQIRLKRAFVRMEVIRKASDARFKYHMFKRLNTGGFELTDQQLRNCTIRLLDPKFNDFVIELSHNEHFRECTANLTDENRYGSFDQELVLRFFAFKNDRESFKHEVGEFLTDYMEKVTEGRVLFDYANEEAVFRKTFAVLAKSLGELVFGLPDPKGDRINRGFSVYHYEALTEGIQDRLGEYDPGNANQMASLKAKLEAIKLHRDFREITTGGGKNSPGPLRRRIDYVREHLAD